MNGGMHDWIVMGVMFAGAPALALARRWDAIAAGETLPRACGPEPARRPAAAPVRTPEVRPVIDPERAPAPAYLRLCRIDEGMDAERRARRHEGHGARRLLKVGRLPAFAGRPFRF